MTPYERAREEIKKLEETNSGFVLLSDRENPSGMFIVHNISRRLKSIFLAVKDYVGSL